MAIRINWHFFTDASLMHGKIHNDYNNILVTKLEVFINISVHVTTCNDHNSFFCVYISN